MNLKKTLLELFGIEKSRERKRILAAILEKETKKRETDELRRKILRFPPLQFSRDELAALPKGEDIDLKTYPLGTTFICTPMPQLPDIIVVGQIVKGRDLFAEQWGAGLSVPERGINRYLAKFL